MDNQNTMSRRSFLRNSLRMAVVGAGTVAIASGTVQAESGAVFEVVKTDEEWREQLGEASYQVLRHEDTERPGTSPLLAEKREGVYHCKGCDLPTYESKTKYESGTFVQKYIAAVVVVTLVTSLTMAQSQQECVTV